MAGYAPAACSPASRRTTPARSPGCVMPIQPVPAGLEGLAQSFIRNDCQAQLDVLIDTFASPSAS